MKNTSYLIAIGLICFGLQASATTAFAIQFSKTYAFPVSSLEKVEAALRDAAVRTDAKSADMSYLIDASQNSSVYCAAGLPEVVDNTLYGCTLNFVVDIGGGGTITAREMLMIRQSSKEINDLLAKTDPNKTARVVLGTPFDGGHGSKYFCHAEGATGAKAWVCYLTVVD